MIALVLHSLHESWGAVFGTAEGCEVVRHYGNVHAEHRALHERAAVLDLGCRTRLAVVGADRDRFLNGQVTNDLQRLPVGHGCYAAIVNARGKMEGDANLYRLPDEWLLDAEPGQAERLAARLERYVIADDVRVLDAAPHYGLLSVQGPQAAEVLRRAAPGVALPGQPFTLVTTSDAVGGTSYYVNQPRFGRAGFDLYVPRADLATMADRLRSAVEAHNGRWVGWEASEIARIEAGIPRYGPDMDETNLPPEAGLEARAISYSKGCYIGQEIIARIRTYGQVAKSLRGLRLAAPGGPLPGKGDALLKDGQPVGYLTSAVRSPLFDHPIALGYVRRECHTVGTSLAYQSAAGEGTADIVPLPFVNP